MDTTLKYGIDVSEHNGQIDWDAAKASGKVEFAILRAGYGKGRVDAKFHRNAQECNRLGIPIGIYWFSYAKNPAEAEQEAKYCLDVIKGYKIEYPVCFDFEDDSVKNCKNAGITIGGKDFATSLAQSFLSVIKRAGYKAANYTNPAYLNQYFDAAKLTAYDLWLAQWPYTPDPSIQPVSQPEIWQYSSTGKIPGIATNVDLNACYVNYVTEEVTPTSTAPTVPSVMNQRWAHDAVEKARAFGISDGSRPDDPATRAEVMAMVIRAVEKFMPCCTINPENWGDELKKTFIEGE